MAEALRSLPRALLLTLAMLGAALPVAAGSVAADPLRAASATPVFASPGASGYATATLTARSRPLALSPGQVSGRGAVSPPKLVRPQSAAGAGTTRTVTSAPRVQTITSASAKTATATPGVSNVQSLITHDQEVAFNGLNVAPPDTQLAAGPNHLVAVVNAMGKIINRNTAAVMQFDTNTFFQVPRGFIASDPKIIFDAASGRWYLSTLAFDGATSNTFDSYVFLAVSTSNDPTGNWGLYTVVDQHTSHMLCDQPHLGFSDDKVTIACDEFDSNGFFQGDLWLVVDKNALLNGTSAAEYGQAFTDTDHVSLQPVYSTTSTWVTPTGAQRASSVQYIVWNPTSPQTYGIFAVWGNPAQQNIGWAQARLPINPTSLPPRAPEPGTTSTIDTGDFRFDSAVFRSGTIWAAGGDGCIPNGDTTQRACLRLVQIKVGGFPLFANAVSVTEDFDVGMFVQGIGDYLYYPAVTMDGGGTTYLSYTESSTADVPTVYVSDIIAANPGAIDQAVLVQAGAGPYVGPASAAGGTRFGDYGAAAPDPNDAHTVWIAGEVGAYEMNHLNDWGTVGASFSMPPCSSLTLSAAPPSPSVSGTQIVFAAAASGCSRPLYEFWILPPGSHTWQIGQAYSSTPTFSWNTTSLAPGDYTYTAWARDTSSSGTFCSNLGCNDAYFPATTYTLTTLACTSVTDSVAPGTPQVSGTTVTFTASASSCPNPLYQFWTLAPGSHTWQIAQAYSSTATFIWNTTALAPGNYTYTVWARDASSSGTFCGNLGCNDTYSPATTYSLTSKPCTSVNDVAAPGSPQLSGTTITFTAGASGCPNPRYQFWILAPGSTTWQVAQAYSSTATFSWNTSGLRAGSYTYTVWARDASSTGTSCSNLGCSDTYFPATAYSLTSQPCTSVTDVASPGSPQTRGTPITFTAGASGCPHPLYQFWVLAPGSTTWQVGQAYSPTATFNWDTTGLPAGAYRYTVWARDASSPGISSNNLGTFDAYYPATSYTLS